MTPRYNPDVNGYWMCDIGRFDYHWVEGEARLRRPMMRSGGALEPAGWHDVHPKVRDRLQEATAASSLRFLVSAHAAVEELFVPQPPDFPTGRGAPGYLKTVWLRLA